MVCINESWGIPEEQNLLDQLKEVEIGMPALLNLVRKHDCDMNVLALVRNNRDKYIFLYDDESRAEALRTLGRYASNPDLSFEWYDAAVLSQKIRQLSQETAKEKIDVKIVLPEEAHEESGPVGGMIENPYPNPPYPIDISGSSPKVENSDAEVPTDTFLPPSDSYEETQVPDFSEEIIDIDPMNSFFRSAGGLGLAQEVAEELRHETLEQMAGGVRYVFCCADRTHSVAQKELNEYVRTGVLPPYAKKIQFTTKEGDAFEFILTMCGRRDVLVLLGKYAQNEKMSFSWYDAALCSKKIRELFEDED